MRIENSSQVFAALQSELVRRMQEMRRPRSVSRTASVSHAARGSTVAGEQAMQRVQVRLGQIPSDDPDSASRVFQIFLESILIEHFGEAMVLDPAFFEMVGEVQRQMEANPELAKRIKALAKSILQPGRHGESSP